MNQPWIYPGLKWKGIVFVTSMDDDMHPNTHTHTHTPTVRHVYNYKNMKDKHTPNYVYSCVDLGILSQPDISTVFLHDLFVSHQSPSTGNLKSATHLHWLNRQATPSVFFFLRGLTRNQRAAGGQGLTFLLFLWGFWCAKKKVWSLWRKNFRVNFFFSDWRIGKPIIILCSRFFSE